MKLPTTPELDALVKNWDDKQFNAELTADVRLLLKEAHGSEKLRSIALGFCHSLFRSMTFAAGLEPGSVLSVFLIGLRMGIVYANQHGGPEAKALDEWLSSLDTSLPGEEKL